MIRNDYLITCYYYKSMNLFEGLMAPDIQTHRLNSKTEDEIDMFIKGLKIGLNDRLNGNIEKLIIEKLKNERKS